MPGQRFTAIPQTGVLTTGDDTLVGESLFGIVDALGGDDLVQLDYSRQSADIEVQIFTGPDGVQLDVTAMNAGYLGAVNFRRFDITTGSGFDVIETSLGNATLDGGAGNDVISLTGRADSFDGRFGGTVLRGGEGFDLFMGVTIFDRIDGGGGFDIAQIDLRSSLLSPVELGQGTLVPQWQGLEAFVGHLTAGNDIYNGRALVIPMSHPIYGILNPSLNAGAGEDTLILNYANVPNLIGPGDFLVSTSFTRADFFRGDGEPGDSGELLNFERFFITGTAFADVFDIRSGDTLIRGGAGNDRFAVQAGNHTIYGDDGDDTFILSGPALGQLHLYGGAGDDYFDNAALNDVIFGGAGVDSVSVDLRALHPRGVSINMRDLSASTNWSGIERIDGTLSNGNDTLAGRGLSAYVDGGLGRDLLQVSYGVGGFTDMNFDPTGVYRGRGDAGAARMLDALGQEFVASFFNFDVFDISATQGNDTFAGGSLNDTLRGLDGNDLILGDLGNDRIEGGAGNDTLDGGAGNDRLFGGSGDDDIFGGIGNDSIAGGAGDDLIDAGDGSDRVLGGRGQDSLFGGGHNDTLIGGGEADFLHGGSGADVLYGGKGNDILLGGLGFDTLYGGSGQDLLVAGGSGDVMSGGNGADTFYFSADFTGRARITDFQRTLDVLRFDETLEDVEFTLRQRAEGVLVSWGTGSVLLESMQLAQLDPARFVFETLPLPDL